jgi:hypothetical protein
MGLNQIDPVRIPGRDMNASAAEPESQTGFTHAQLAGILWGMNASLSNHGQGARETFLAR